MVQKINKFLCCTALSTVLLGNAAGAKEIETNMARMQAMDKITGKVSEIEVPVNGEAVFGSFSVVVRFCATRPAEETPENFAFVDVVDNYKSEKPINVFKGWMLSSSPALNAVEHPIYDVWLLSCHNGDVSGKKLLTANELEARDKILPAVPEKEDKAPVSEPAKEEPAAEEKAAESAPVSEPAEAKSEQVAETPAETVLFEEIDTIEEDGAPKSLLNLHPASAKEAVDPAKAAVSESVNTTDNSDVVENVLEELKTIEEPTAEAISVPVSEDVPADDGVSVKIDTTAPSPAQENPGTDGLILPEAVQQASSRPAETLRSDDGNQLIFFEDEAEENAFDPEAEPTAAQNE